MNRGPVKGLRVHKAGGMPTELHFSEPKAAPTSTPSDQVPSDQESAVNAVFLAATLTGPAEERELAGGVKVVRWTVRVLRGPGRVGTDLIDCVALDDDLQLRALTWPQGSALFIEGAIRRRFFRTGGRTTTRVEVEAHVVTEQAGGAPPQSPAA